MTAMALASEDAKSIAHARGALGYGHQPQTCGSQLDGQRHPLHRPHDLSHLFEVRRLELESRTLLARPLDEQLHSRRDAQRLHDPDDLAAQVEPLAARHEE